MNFVQLKILCDQETAEILIAELSQLDFDSFEEVDDGLLAACPEDEWDEAATRSVLDKYLVESQTMVVPQINWNKEWEKHYDPVVIGKEIFVGATFHEFPAGYKHYLRINPKMSFGTGHHATTSQVLEAQLTIDHHDKKVLDVGCGTGVLSILAHQLGASSIKSIDIDEWCIENSRENFTLNHCENIDLKLSGIDGVKETEDYDIILANINRNVLMDQMKDYATRLSPGGYLLMSGFYMEDVDFLLPVAKSNGLQLCFQKNRDRWSVLVMKKDGS